MCRLFFLSLVVPSPHATSDLFRKDPRVCRLANDPALLPSFAVQVKRASLGPLSDADAFQNSTPLLWKMNVATLDFGQRP